jgi:type IV pilus assembly protein PilC
MSSYCYEAVDGGGLKTHGTIDVADQSEALRRIKEMGLFPVKIVQAGTRWRGQLAARRKVVATPSGGARLLTSRLARTLAPPFFGERVKSAHLAVFTRQLATLIEAGMPLLRGLRTLREQEESPALKRIIGELAEFIESGGSLSEGLAAHPKVFDKLYVNMAKAGELGGVLEITLRRLAEFMEKAQKIKGKVKAAMFYPVSVLVVAMGILALLMIYVIPRFQQIFEGLLNGASMPAFTMFVLKISEMVRGHFVFTGIGALAFLAAFMFMLRTTWGRAAFDRFKLRMPVLGPVFRKIAVSRFARTLGTLLQNGVPILQALTIVRETVGNVIVANLISKIHDSVKEGETVAAPMKASRVFPAMVAGMVDVGEQTGALPDLLMKVADNYDEEVDNAVSAMTSLLEPIMIVFLAVIVGSIVIAMFLPLIEISNRGFDPTPNDGQ